MKQPRHLHAARRSRAGFSLAELMVVIVIIGLLATLVVPAVVARLGTAYEGKVKSDLAALDRSLEEYFINNQMQYPDSLQELVTPDENGRTYLTQETVPKDPWGREYLYEQPSGNRAYCLVMSYGKDGSPGGEGADRDLSNEMIRRQEF